MVPNRPLEPQPPDPGQRGFTLIELLIALTVLLIGVSGILSMHIASMRATSYSRHATEAAVLGEDRMEQLRTLPVDSIPASSTTLVDAQGQVSADGPYTVNSQITWADGIGTQIVTVSWLERGSEPHAVVMRTQRAEETGL
jgi:prepilin-type N-terminal cleavage/methylation domain-containing protein